MVMVIIGILAAVSIPRFANVVRQSEAASEQGVLVNMVAALDTYSHERFIEDGIMEWPDNPFDALNKVPASYDKTGTIHISEMDDSDWIFTADKSDEYPNAIVHRRKEASLAVWTYNQENGEIGFDVIYDDNFSLFFIYEHNEAFSTGYTGKIHLAIGYLPQKNTNFAFKIEGDDILKSKYIYTKNVNGLDINFYLLNNNAMRPETFDEIALNLRKVF